MNQLGKIQSIFSLLLVLGVLMALVSFSPVAVASLETPGSLQVTLLAPVAQADVDFNSLLATLLAMGGFASLVAVLVNVGKSVGIVKDGTAKTWAAGLNILGLIGLYVLQIFAPDVSVGQVDGIASSVSQILVLVLSLVAQMGITLGANGVVKTLPLVGYSYSAEQEKLDSLEK